MNEVIPAGEGPATSISPSPARSLSVFDGEAKDFSGALTRRSENRDVFISWLRRSLKEGTDFGRIHTTSRKNCQAGGPPRCNIQMNPSHWSKPSLFKSGAEKICGMLGVTPTYPTMREYERAVLEGTQLFSVLLRCEIVAADGVTVLGHGAGSRSLEKDDNDLNKSLKMAMKSSLISATLSMAGISEIFTQDLEDMERERERAEREHNGNGGGGATPSLTPSTNTTQQFTPSQGQQHGTQPSNGNGQYATEKQVYLIEKRLGEHGVDPRDLCSSFEFASIREIPKSAVNAVLDWIGKGGPRGEQEQATGQRPAW